MIIVYYYHVGRNVQYSKEFTDYNEARKFYNKMKHVPYYVTEYTCNTETELLSMEGVIK